MQYDLAESRTIVHMCCRMLEFEDERRNKSKSRKRYDSL